MRPGADLTSVRVLHEVAFAQLLAKLVVANERDNLHDDVDVAGRARLWGRRLGDPERHGRRAEEGDLSEQLRA